MEPYLRDPDVTLYQGDAPEVLRELPARSVHACMTSPPFYGLRDYGTGEWEGGDAECEHKPRAASRAERPASGLTGGKATVDAATIQHSACHCGARRVDRQIGLEETPDEWVARLVDVFREVRRVLRDDGTLWVEIGDSYASNPSKGGSGPNGKNEERWGYDRTGRNFADAKPKDILGQPWLLAFALRDDGWYLRSEIIWARPNPMPESVTDRPTKAHSTVFLLSKSPRYFYDADAIREPSIGRAVFGNSGTKATLNGDRQDGERNDMTPNEGANARSVWTIPTEPTPFAHFATWPQALVRRMILAGTSERGCCPGCGAPWVRQVDHTPIKKYVTGKTLEKQAAGGSVNDSRTALSGAVGPTTPTRITTGWSPSCECCDCGHSFTESHRTPGAECFKCDCGSHRPPAPVPCTVLDPFAGSGTTSLVARNHGRHSIGIELNEQYLEIAARRLQQLSLLADA